MPDGFSVIRLASLDQLGNLPPERIGNRAAIAADSVCIADTFGPVGIADTAGYQFESVDCAVRAVREANGQRDPIEAGVDRLDKRHLVSALFQILNPVSTIASAFTSDDCSPEGTASLGARWT
jgi:hypothetical protein